MGFLEKVKNMFIEEVEDDDTIRVEKVTKEIASNSIDSFSSTTDELDLNLSEELEEKSKPIFFDDSEFNDFNNESKVKQEIQKDEYVEENIDDFRKVDLKDNFCSDHYDENNVVSYDNQNLYNQKENNVKVEESSLKPEKKNFKPTPIISPVYGVLDKNYHKEDIVSKRDYKDGNASEPSIDQVRNKAYGTLEDELENTLFGKNSILFDNENDSSIEEIDELDTGDLSILTDDISKEIDELLSKKEKYDNKEIKSRMKKNNTLSDDDLLNFIDSTLYKDGDDE